MCLRGPNPIKTEMKKEKLIPFADSFRQRQKFPFFFLKTSTSRPLLFPEQMG
jgi:hypothetical protein